MYICKLNFINDLDQGDTYSDFFKAKTLGEAPVIANIYIRKQKAKKQAGSLRK